MLSHPVELSLNTLSIAMRWAQCEDLHSVFAGGERYLPRKIFGEVSIDAYEELSGLGLVQGNLLTEDFEYMLHILGNPDQEYYAFTRTGDESRNFLTAIKGKSALTAEHHDRRVRLSPAPKENPEKSLTQSLPPFPAAEFTSFSLPQREWQDLNATLEPYAPRKTPSRTARKLQEIIEQPCCGFAELHSARIDSAGNKENSRDSLMYLDTESGRVGIHLNGPEKNRHLTIFPGDSEQLLSRLIQ